LTSRLCSRCHTVLHREDEGTLVFCWNCGAPQVQLSQDLLEQIEKQIAGQIGGPSALDPLPTLPPPGAVVWPGAIRCAALAGAVAAAFGLLSFALPPISLLSVFWLIGAPAFILIIYTGRFRQTRITAGFGARLGVLSGLAIVFISVTLNTLDLFLRRFVFHSAGPVDARLADSFDQMRTAFVAQSGPAAGPALAMLAIPEFRAGLILSAGFALLVFYLAFSATAGALSGYVRSRAPR
jgi:hypothetical protein